MLKLLALKDAYFSNEAGATAIEYGLMVAAIALAIIALVFVLGDRIEAGFQGIDDEFAANGL